MGQLCKALAHKQRHNYQINLVKELAHHIDDPIHILENTFNDVKAFAAAVFFQDIYSEFGLLKKSDAYAVSSGFRHPDRGQLKHESIAETLYSYFNDPEKDVTKENWDSRSVRSVLRGTYRGVYDFLVQCASESSTQRRSKDLAILMQNYEGFFFHRVLQERLAGLLDGRGYVIIHDAVYVPESLGAEALYVAKQAAQEWFGSDQMFSL